MFKRTTERVTGKKEESGKRFLHVTAVVMVMLLLVAAGCGRDEQLSPREIVIEELNGTAQVRNKGETWDGYQGLKLVSGDEVCVGADSNLTLLMEKDRHIFADAGSMFRLEAEGKPGKGSITVHLFKGTAIVGQDGKPADKDVFAVTSPNVRVTALEKKTVFTLVIASNEITAQTTVSIDQGAAEVTTMLGGAERKQSLVAGESSTYTGNMPEHERGSGKKGSRNDAVETEKPQALDEDGAREKKTESGTATEASKTTEDDRPEETTKTDESFRTDEEEPQESETVIMTHKQAMKHNFLNATVQIGRVLIFIAVVGFLIRFFGD
ncbi:MAG: hypothetical protein K6G81_11670 [Lachnospiraceae bacterium]|nr:hypothetical protein [Lachnospiraceae bacterium]